MRNLVHLHATRRVAPQAKGGVCVDSDIGYLIKDSTIVCVDGVPTVLYYKVTEDLEPYRRALRNIRYATDYRTSGLKTTSRTIGFLPRVVIRHDFCTTATSALEHPAEHAIVADGARLAADYYTRDNLLGYLTHLKEAARIRPEWMLAGTPFTSGTINLSNAVRYHHDRGNIKGAWSAMYGFRHGVEGGHLACPELLGPDGRPLGFEISDKSLLIFDGQGLLHGVTPIQKTRRDAYRYTVVYYTLAQMWHCLTPEEELKRYRAKRTEREHKKLEAGYDPRGKGRGVK